MMTGQLVPTIAPAATSTGVNATVAFLRQQFRSYVLDSAGWPLPSTLDELQAVAGCECRGLVWRPCPRIELCWPVAALSDDPVPFAAGMSLAARRVWYADLAVDAVDAEPWLTRVAGYRVL